MATTATKATGWRKVEYSKSMAHRRPELAQDFHPTKNGDMTPDVIAPGINKNLWWLCHKCGHEWQAYGHTRSRGGGTGCPACAKRTVTPTYNLAAVRPHIAAEWHPTKNGDHKPEHFTPGSGHRAWWLCSHGHEWETQINHRNGKGCPFCAHKTETRNLDDYPHRKKELHYREKERKTFRASDKVWWTCLKCDHDWHATIGNRKHGTGCPACAGQVATPKNCFANAHPDLVAEWHPSKNDITPDDVTVGANKKVWWLCNTCSAEWLAPVVQRHMGSGCPQCAIGGYDQSQPGVLYVLTGEPYGKIGISNRTALNRRMNTHRLGGVYGDPVIFFDFEKGTDAPRVETKLKAYIRGNFTIEGKFDGYTEAFPSANLELMVELAVEEIERLGCDYTVVYPECSKS